MPRKSYGSDSADSRLPNFPSSSTKAQKRHVFGVTEQELEAILVTVRRFMKLYLDINHHTTHQKDQLSQVENAVKEAYPDLFANNEFKMRHLRSYIYNNHASARSVYLRKANKRGGMGEVAEMGTSQTEVSALFGEGEGGEGDAATMDEGAGPSGARGLRQSALQPESQRQDTPSSSTRQASLPPDSVGQTVHVHPNHSAPPRAKRGRPPKRSRRLAEESRVTSPVNASASTSRLASPQIEVVLQSTQPAFPPTAQVPKAETPPNEDADSGLKEVERFLTSTCKPSLVHLLDHLVYYGCVSGDFLRVLAGRAARLQEEEFHKYLRNHFSKGRGYEGTVGRRDLTEMEILVLTEGLLKFEI